MTTKQLVIGGLALVGAWWAFAGEAKAAPQAPVMKAPPPRAKAAVQGLVDRLGLVGSATHHADGSVTECEQDFWAGVPKFCKRFTAAEWAYKESAINAALDRGESDSPLYSVRTYNAGTVV